MRYAFVSDIHANIQAWQKVAEDIKSNNVDRIICLGDVIGYGPNPSEVLHDLRYKVDAFVLGNHDAAICGKLDESLFNDDARVLLTWTRKQLSSQDITFLGTFPLTLVGDGFLCAHGEFAEPGSFDYVLEANEALPSWKATNSNLLLVGHTHEPALYVMGASGTPRTVEPQDFVVDPQKRYFVNIGSVGQPRTADMRASYCIYDTEIRAIYWRRVAFDVEAYRKSLKATGLTLDPSYYLPEAKGAEAAGPKRRIVFTPPKSRDKAAHDVVAVQDLKSVAPRKKKIPKEMISALVVVVIVVSILIWRAIPHPCDIIGASSKAAIPSSGNVLSFPAQTVEPGEPIQGWNVHLDDKLNQKVGVRLNPFNKPVSWLRSKKASRSLEFTSKWVAIEAKQCWTIIASAQKKEEFSGRATLLIVLKRKGEARNEVIFRQDFGPAQANGISTIEGQVTIPESGDMIQVVVHGNFSGTILIHQLDFKQVSAPAAATIATPTAPSAPPPASTDKWAMPPKK